MVKKTDFPDCCRGILGPRCVLIGLIGVIGMMVIGAGLSSCNTEADYMPWYLPWTTAALSCDEGLLDTQSTMDNGNFKSFRFPDGRIFHAAVRSSGDLAPLRVVLLAQDGTVSWSFASFRLGQNCLARSYVDEKGGLHLRGDWSSGEFLVPPPAGSTSGWTRAANGDTAEHNFADTGVFRCASASTDSTMEFRLDMSAYPAIGLSYLNLEHNSDGSLANPGAYDESAPTYLSTPVFAGGFQGHLRELYPGLAATMTESELQDELINILSYNPNGPWIRILSVQPDPDPANDWTRPMVRVLLYVESQFGQTVTLPPSELVEISFPFLFQSDTDPALVFASHPTSLGMAVYSQNRVFEDAAQKPAFPVVSTSDTWAMADKGLVLARSFLWNGSPCRYLLRYDKDADPEHDALLCIPGPVPGTADQDYPLPLLGGYSGYWFMWNHTGHDLYANRPWWEATP